MSTVSDFGTLWRYPFVTPFMTWLLPVICRSLHRIPNHLPIYLTRISRYTRPTCTWRIYHTARNEEKCHKPWYMAKQTKYSAKIWKPNHITKCLLSICTDWNRRPATKTLMLFQWNRIQSLTNITIMLLQNLQSWKLYLFGCNTNKIFVK